mgnify:FL=1|jgi:hypothetical protein
MENLKNMLNKTFILDIKLLIKEIFKLSYELVDKSSFIKKLYSSILPNNWY